MTKTLNAVYDGKVLRLHKSLELKPNTQVKIKIESIIDISKKKSFLKTAKSLKLEGPNDWSVNLENYLYGEKKL